MYWTLIIASSIFLINFTTIENVIYRPDENNNRKLVLFHNLFKFLKGPLNYNSQDFSILWGVNLNFLNKIKMLSLNWVFLLVLVGSTRYLLYNWGSAVLL